MHSLEIKTAVLPCFFLFHSSNLLCIFHGKTAIFYDNMEGGIYIYENADDFLKAIRQIERLYKENDENSS